jgi:hypothetical protein
MDSGFMNVVARGLAARGLRVARFEFPYMAKRRGGSGGRGAPDRPPVLEATWLDVIAMLGGGRDLVIGGKSMGGRMASHLAAAGEAVDGLLFLGYPLHPAGKPEKLRAAHLQHIGAPMLFLAGTRDALCRLDLLRATLAGLPRATLHVVDDGDHSFAVRKRSGRDQAAVRSELVDASLTWLATAVQT